MEVVFDKSFLKSIGKLNSKAIKQKVENVVIEIELATKLSDIKNLKKMEGFKSYYRIRINDYRLGFELEKSNVVRLITIAHRKDIYKVFP